MRVARPYFFFNFTATLSVSIDTIIIPRARAGTAYKEFPWAAENARVHFILGIERERRYSLISHNSLMDLCLR